MYVYTYVSHILHTYTCAHFIRMTSTIASTTPHSKQLSPHRHSHSSPNSARKRDREMGEGAPGLREIAAKNLVASARKERQEEETHPVTLRAMAESIYSADTTPPPAQGDSRDEGWEKGWDVVQQITPTPLHFEGGSHGDSLSASQASGASPVLWV